MSPVAATMQHGTATSLDAETAPLQASLLEEQVRAGLGSILNNQHRSVSLPQPPAKPVNAASPSVAQVLTPWQSDADIDERRRMILSILLDLKQRRKDLAANWLKKLPQLARSLESLLYRRAQSFQEYADKATLTKRLHELAIDLGRKSAARLAQRQRQLPLADRNGCTRDQQGCEHESCAQRQGSFLFLPGGEAASKGRDLQQRLLLFRHAAMCSCNAGNGDQCHMTPHCSFMKDLWAHIRDCKDKNCQVQHCLSSKYILAHYHKCKNVRCMVCEPVRASIREARARSKRGKGKNDAVEGVTEQMAKLDTNDAKCSAGKGKGPKCFARL
mmetsp:Transcript_19205/g.72573  ORF Transcript_19205/g.72573 Transcript_19205/m.72573 type:complete len:330 (-) Transcript_19205:322-1311(-)|eukprot:scaffold1435_cov267-Pinguiococcus_pyrenoidosus.AAC.42